MEETNGIHIIRTQQDCIRDPALHIGAELARPMYLSLVLMFG